MCIVTFVRNNKVVELIVQQGDMLEIITLLEQSSVDFMVSLRNGKTAPTQWFLPEGDYKHWKQTL